jgi:hypothetical protein
MGKQCLFAAAEGDLCPSWVLRRHVFGPLVAEMGRTDSSFVPDFLHFMECFRNRLSTHPVSLHGVFPPVCAGELAGLLSILDAVKPKSNGAQLKDALALGSSHWTI